MHLTLVLCTFAFILFIYWLIKRFLDRHDVNIPPGPYGLPIVGYLPFLSEQPHKVLSLLGKKYGNVFSIQMGANLGIVLNDWKAIKAALIDQSETFSGRPILDIINDVGGRFGIIGTDGQPWKHQRRFSLSRLKDFGFGKRNMESIIQQEVDDLCALTERDGKEGIDVKSILVVPFLNVIWSLVANKRFEYDDENLPYFKKLLTEFIQLSGVSDFLFLPKFIIQMGFRKSLRLRRKQVVQELLGLMEKEIEEHRQTLVPDMERDFLDSYLVEMAKEQQNSPEPWNQRLSESHLKLLASNFFLAGVETTASTLGWSILYLGFWTEVQQKVDQEIVANLGEDRLPTLSDRTLLPYTNAVIMEVQRYSSLVPLSIAHRNMKSTTLLGYHIPKDCVVMPNLWNVLHDPELWGDPENFRPERFLSSEGHLIKPEYFIPFSAGARICLGESLAKMELFLFLTNLVRRFVFKLPPGAPKPDTPVKFGVALAPPYYKMIFEKRT